MAEGDLTTTVITGKQITDIQGDRVCIVRAGTHQLEVEAGNNIVQLDEAETARWQEAAQPTIDGWFEGMTALGLDGQALYEAAKAAIEAETT